MSKKFTFEIPVTEITTINYSTKAILHGNIVVIGIVDGKDIEIDSIKYNGRGEELLPMMENSELFSDAYDHIIQLTSEHTKEMKYESRDN